MQSVRLAEQDGIPCKSMRMIVNPYSYVMGIWFSFRYWWSFHTERRTKENETRPIGRTASSNAEASCGRNGPLALMILLKVTGLSLQFPYFLY